MRITTLGMSDGSNKMLDTCGLLCPLPVLKARKRLESLASGEMLMVTADDPAARVDFPHFCTEQGHTLVRETERPGGILVFAIRKG
jgi:tRNA 2-thiouridine synthesizing protein A